jgi:hypothetical protein
LAAFALGFQQLIGNCVDVVNGFLRFSLRGLASTAK